MCGIAGFTGHALGETELHRAIDALRHRGPDGRGTYLDPGAKVGLGHARLSIIDLQTGGQPLYSEQRDIALIANGEIYDFERIRVDLETRGHAFATHSDSEVIIHLYQEYGLDFVQHLRGEFAILLYDKPAHKLIAVRDRFGIKPLYFNKQGGKYLFGSEAKALFATGALRPRIDPKAIRDCLCVVTPDSIFEGVEVVPPGCIMQVDVAAGTHTTTAYWDLDLPANTDESRPMGSNVQAVRTAIEEAVRLRLRADVPVGVYLSGGIDSAIVAATVARLAQNHVKVFTIEFPDSSVFNEYHLAKNMAAKAGAEFHSVRCDHKALIENAADSLWTTELPFFNFHGVGKFMLSALAREHVKVVLTGEGSDEVFLGYIVFQPGKGGMSDQFSKNPKPRKPPTGPHVDRMMEVLGCVPMRELAMCFSARYQRAVGWMFNRKHRSELAAHHPLERLARRHSREQVKGRPLARCIQYLWIKFMLAPYILTMLGDRSEMGHSIEGRTPFLDHKLFELAREIPDAHKIHNGVEKHVLREAFKDDVTEEIYNRKKWPYTAPPQWIEKGHNETLDALIDAHLSRTAIQRAGIFNIFLVRFLQLAAKALFFDCAAKRGLNSFLLFVLTAQMLDHLFVQDFEATLAGRAR